LKRDLSKQFFSHPKITLRDLKWGRHQWLNWRFAPGGGNLAEGGPLANPQKSIKMIVNPDVVDICTS